LRQDSIEHLEFIQFEFLTKAAVGQFILWSCDHFDELEFTLSLWQSIAKRLLQTAPSEISDSERYAKVLSPPQASTTIPHTPDSPLNGIIAHLTRIHGGNVHAKGIVNVSASATHSRYAAQNAVDLDQQNYFHSVIEPHQWLCYDFKDLRVQITHYSIAAHTSNLFLRSWVVEGSNDGSAWITLDERKDNSDAHASHPIATFKVTRDMSSRYVRLRQTGKCGEGSDCLVLFGFEVFGVLVG
jgi:hypothetical protein